MSIAWSFNRYSIVRFFDPDILIHFDSVSADWTFLIGSNLVPSASNTAILCTGIKWFPIHTSRIWPKLGARIFFMRLILSNLLPIATSIFWDLDCSIWNLDILIFYCLEIKSRSRTFPEWNIYIFRKYRKNFDGMDENWRMMDLLNLFCFPLFMQGLK